MKQIKRLHPFLFAIYPLLFLFSHNQEELLPTVMIKPAFVALFVTLFILGLFTFVFKNGNKAAILVSLLVILFFSYGHVHKLIGDLHTEINNFKFGSDKFLLGIWGLILLFITYVVARKKSMFENETYILFIISSILVLTSLLRIIPYEIKTRRYLSLFQKSDKKKTILVSGEKKNNLPDIYYLIFDRYPNSSTLKEILNYDNSEFEKSLEEKGFYIASESRANYPKTFESLASSLNMKHLTYLTEQVGENSSDQTTINEMLQDYEVWRFLKARGYIFIHLGSWWEPTRENRYADENISWNYLNLNEFSRQLIENSLAFPIITKIKAVEFDDENSRRVEQKLRIPYKIEKLEELPRKKAPKFVFAHMLLPHGPYVFNAEGRKITEEEVSKKSDAENFLEQLKFTNTKINEVVEQILTKSKNPSIIILQADEGPCGLTKEFSKKGWGQCGEGVDWTKLSDQALRVKIRIFNAYYLPGVKMKDVLYKDITPVNTFRIIFNEYFGANYELLPDKSYIFEDLNHPYKFIDVTEKVDYE